MPQATAAPRRSRTTTDRFHRLGSDFAEAVLPGVESEVLAAFSAVDAASGARPFPEDAELAAFLFDVSRLAAAEAGVPSSEIELLLPAVASWLFHRREGAYGTSPPLFSAFLLRRGSGPDDGAPDPAPEERVMAAVRRLLDGYGLGGADRLDLAFAISRGLEPHLARGRAVLARHDADSRRAPTVVSDETGSDLARSADPPPPP